MSQHSVSFWTQLDTLLHLNAAGDQSALHKLFDQLRAELEASDPAVSSNRRAILEELAVTLDLTDLSFGAVLLENEVERYQTAESFETPNRSTG